jgi:hypothetical protein
MSGIDRTSGHIGTSSSMSTMKAMGGAAFSAVATGGSIAANVMGGPMAGYAVSAGMSALRSGVSSSSGGLASGDGSIADQAGQTAAANADNAKQATMQNIQQSGLDQTDLINLQMAMNSQSQAFNTLTNVQKSRHDAAMAAIQNTR